MSTLLEYALAYAAQGWHVFPIRPAGKEPITEHAHYDATTDAAKIRAWWAQYPAAGIGVAVAPSGLIVLDDDLKASDCRECGKKLPGSDVKEKFLCKCAEPVPAQPGDAITALERELGAEFPMTRLANSGSGSIHAYYRRPAGVDPVRIIRVRKKFKVDLIGDGYIIAPPSGHPSGSFYSWINDATIAELPSVLGDLAGEHRPAEPGPRSEYTGGKPASPELLAHARRMLERHGPSTKGDGGDQHAYKAACMMMRGFDLQWNDAVSLMLEWNEKFPENDWSQAKLETKLINAARYAQGSQGEVRYAFELAQKMGGGVSTPDPFAQIKAAANQILECGVSEENKWALELLRAQDDCVAWAEGRWQSDGRTNEAKIEPYFSPAKELFKKQFPKTAWLVQGVLTERAIAVIGGTPKSTKTWNAIEEAVAIGTGTPAFGEFATGAPRHVALFLTEDEERSVRNRLRALRNPDTLDRVFVACRKEMNLGSDSDLVRLVASCRMLPAAPAMVVLDPLRNLYTGDENDSQAIADLMKRLRCLRDVIGATILFLHHSVKTTGDSSRRQAGENLRGSGAIFGAVDCGFYLSDIDTDDQHRWSNTVHVQIKGLRGAGKFKLDLEVEDDTNDEAIKATWFKEAHVGKNEDSKAAEKLREKVLHAIFELGGKGEVRQIHDKVRPCSWDRLYSALHTLKAEGTLSDDDKRGWKVDPENPVVVGMRAEWAAKKN